MPPLPCLPLREFVRCGRRHLRSGSMKNDRRQRTNSLRQVGLLTTIPMLLLSAPVIGYLIGRQLDRWFKTSFWIWIICLLGMVAGIREVIGILKKASAEAEAEEKSRRNDTE